ncbi:MAG: 30S ribosomal protein S6e [Candidatus Micrarchaeota archaeon]|nr:30S ribosomal protein S6e [Candidatus Micrarchaeota archaeon]
MKLVISEPKSGKSHQAEVAKNQESLFIGRKVGDTVEGGAIGASGYTLKITGGSDLAGFPIRSDVAGPRRSKVLLTGGAGFNSPAFGARQKRLVRGNLISDEIMQINCVVVTAGEKPLAELFPAAKKEEKKQK